MLTVLCFLKVHFTNIVEEINIFVKPQLFVSEQSHSPNLEEEKQANERLSSILNSEFGVTPIVIQVYFSVYHVEFLY